MSRRRAFASRASRVVLAACLGAAVVALVFSCSDPFPILFPVGGDELPSDAGFEGGFDGGSDGGFECGSFGSDAFSGDGGDGGFGDGGVTDGPGDGPLFDVGDLGDCSGLEAKAIPASACGACMGAWAYALCDGVFYSTCACTLPPGYVLADGGGGDGGSGEASPKDAAPDGTLAKDGMGG